MNGYTLLVGNPEGRRPLGKPRCRTVDNIKIDLKEIIWGDLDWLDLAQDMDQSCEHGNERMGFIKCCEVVE
jgi:hypothetical protein